MASEIRVNQIQNRSGLTTTTFTDTGVTISGILTVSENLNVGGVLTYEDVANIDAIGIVTARAGINLVGNDLNVGSNIKIGNASGIVTATSFVGSGANLTGITQTTINSNAANRIITGSGSANTLEGNSNFTYTGSVVTHNNPSGLAKLDVKGSVGGGALGASISVRNTNSANNGSGEFQFQDPGSNIFAKIVGVNLTDGSNNGYMTFHTASATSGLVERLRITSDGKFGFNTNNPLSQVEMHGASIDLNLVDTDSYSAGSNGPAVSFQGNDSAGNRKTFADIHGLSNGSNAGDFRIRTRTGGSLYERLKIKSDGEIVINHTQGHSPLNNTFISIYDANSDSSAIDASGISKNYAMISLHNYGTGVPGDSTGIGFGAGASFGYTKGSIGFERSGSYGTGDLVFLTNNDQDTTMVNSTDVRMRITRQGYVTKPAHPSFCARFQSGDGYVSTNIFRLTGINNDNFTWNTGSHYSTSTGKFTCPVAGVYFFEGQAMTTGHSNNDNIQDMMELRTNNGLVTYCRQRRTYFKSDVDANGYYVNGTSGQVNLAVGDTVWFQRRSGLGYSYGNSHYTYFTGWLIG